MLVSCVLYLILNPQIKRTLTVNSFKKDEKSITVIAQEWKNLDYTYMFTDKDKYKDGIIDIGYNQNDNMSVDKNDENFGYLLCKRKYRYIMKSDNAVYFNKYSSLGNGYGVAFSFDGEKPQNEFIISSEKIDGFNEWYFYIMR